MNRYWLFWLTIVCFFCVPIISIADDVKTEAQPNWNTINQVKQTWLDKLNAKLLPPKYKNVPANIEKLAIPDEKLYLPFKIIPIGQAKALRIPLKQDFSKLNVMEGIGIGRLIELKKTNLESQQFIVATYESNDFKYPILYLQTKSKPKYLSCSDQGCGAFYFFRPDLKMPVSVIDFSASCGSGCSEMLYRLGKDGDLEDKADLGGWHSGINFCDLDGDGQIEVLDSTDVENDFKDLMDELMKIPNFDPSMAGPIIEHTSILKWDGQKYSKIAEFYKFPKE